VGVVKVMQLQLSGKHRLLLTVASLVSRLICHSAAQQTWPFRLADFLTIAPSEGWKGTADVCSVPPTVSPAMTHPTINSFPVLYARQEVPLTSCLMKPQRYCHVLAVGYVNSDDVDLLAINCNHKTNSVTFNPQANYTD
jgi:hypothetical protein